MPSLQDLIERKPSLFDLLGLKVKATQKEAKLIYRKYILQNHPDKRVGKPELTEEGKNAFKAIVSFWNEVVGNHDVGFERYQRALLAYQQATASMSQGAGGGGGGAAAPRPATGQGAPAERHAAASKSGGGWARSVNFALPYEHIKSGLVSLKSKPVAQRQFLEKIQIARQRNTVGFIRILELFLKCAESNQDWYLKEMTTVFVSVCTSPSTFFLICKNLKTSGQVDWLINLVGENYGWADFIKGVFLEIDGSIGLAKAIFGVNLEQAQRILAMEGVTSVIGSVDSVRVFLQAIADTEADDNVCNSKSEKIESVLSRVDFSFVDSVGALQAALRIFPKENHLTILKKTALPNLIRKDGDFERLLSCIHFDFYSNIVSEFKLRNHLNKPRRLREVLAVLDEQQRLVLLAKVGRILLINLLSEKIFQPYRGVLLNLYIIMQEMVEPPTPQSSERLACAKRLLEGRVVAIPADAELLQRIHAATASA